jgi:hypothetical protein
MRSEMSHEADFSRTSCDEDLHSTNLKVDD